MAEVVLLADVAGLFGTRRSSVEGFSTWHFDIRSIKGLRNSRL